jgi:hypothetical protein
VPSDHDLEGIPAVQEAKKYQGRWLRIAAFGIVLLGVAAIINAVDDWADSRSNEDRIQTLNDQFTCRYVVGQESQELQSRMTLELALGLAAYAQGDRQGLQEHTNIILEISPQLDEALQERAEAAEFCHNPRE